MSPLLMTSQQRFTCVQSAWNMIQCQAAAHHHLIELCLKPHGSMSAVDPCHPKAHLRSCLACSKLCESFPWTLGKSYLSYCCHLYQLHGLLLPFCYSLDSNAKAHMSLASSGGHHQYLQGNHGIARPCQQELHWTNLHAHLCSAAQVPLLAPLTSTQRSQLCPAMKQIHVPAGTTIVKRGEPGDTFCVIESGTCSVLGDDGLVRLFVIALITCGHGHHTGGHSRDIWLTLEPGISIQIDKFVRQSSNMDQQPHAPPQEDLQGGDPEGCQAKHDSHDMPAVHHCSQSAHISSMGAALSLRVVILSAEVMLHTSKHLHKGHARRQCLHFQHGSVFAGYCNLGAYTIMLSLLCMANLCLQAGMLGCL